MIGLALFALLGLVAPAADLELTARQARSDRLPIMLYVSRSDCTFCRRFETEVLNPLIRSKAVRGRIVMRELMWDRAEPLVDFAGDQITAEALAARYDARLTPTVLFLDADGRELVKRITGYGGSEYASYYLESAIEQAWRVLNEG